MNYKTHITPFSKNFIKIKITKDNYVKASNFGSATFTDRIL